MNKKQIKTVVHKESPESNHKLPQKIKKENGKPSQLRGKEINSANQNERGDVKTEKTFSLRLSAGLKFFIKESNLHAQIGQSNGSFILTPDLIVLLLEIQKLELQNFENGSVYLNFLYKNLKVSAKEIGNNLPSSEEMLSLITDMQEAGVILVKSSEQQNRESKIQDGFADPWIQWAMLADEVRCLSYFKAMKKRINNNSIVLDIGSGTGVLSSFACQFKAKKVYAIEETNSANFLRAMLKQEIKNGQVVVFQSSSLDFEPPAEAEIAVSELFGNDPFSEGLIETLRDISKKLKTKSKKNVTFIPDKIQINLGIANLIGGSAFERVSHYHNVSKKKIKNDLERNTFQLTDHDLQTVNTFRSKFSNLFLENDISFPCPLQKEDYTLLKSNSSHFLNLNPVSTKQIAFKFESEFLLKESIDLPVIILWYRVWLDDIENFCTLSGEKNAADHWAPILIPLNEMFNYKLPVKVHAWLNEEENKINVCVKNGNYIIGSR